MSLTLLFCSLDSFKGHCTTIAINGTIPSSHYRWYPHDRCRPSRTKKSFLETSICRTERQRTPVSQVVRADLSHTSLPTRHPFGAQHLMEAPRTVSHKRYYFQYVAQYLSAACATNAARHDYSHSFYHDLRSLISSLILDAVPPTPSTLVIGSPALAPFSNSLPWAYKVLDHEKIFYQNHRGHETLCCFAILLALHAQNIAMRAQLFRDTVSYFVSFLYLFSLHI